MKRHKNWVEQTGGLPPKIKRIARAVREKNPDMTEGHSIAIAVNACKRQCLTGDLNFPGLQQVMPGTRAEACATIAQWEKQRAQARADNK